MITTRKKTIIFVEPISTIWRIIADTKKMGYLPIIIFVNYELYKENEAYETLVMRDKTAQEFEDDFKQVAKIIYQPKSYDKLLQLLAPYNVCGVLKGSDGGVLLGEKLAKTFKFKSNNENFFTWALDKKIVNDTLIKNKLRGISTLTFNRETKINNFLKKIKQYPVFVKPKQGAGGVNSFVAINADILANGLKRLVDLQGNGNNLYDEILVQELIMGDEYVVNTFSEDGEHYVVEVWKYIKGLTKEGATIYRNTILLSKNSIVREYVVKYAIDVLDCLDFRNGPCHMEIKVDQNGPVLIECNWRIMGGSQFYDTDITMGCSTCNFYLNSVLDNNYCKKHVKSKFVDYHSFAEVLDIMPQVHGVITQINIPYILRKMKSYYTSVIFVKKGDTVIPATSIDEDLGNVQFRHRNYETLKHDVDLFMEIEDYCLELLFEFKNKLQTKRLLPKNSKTEIKVLEEFVGDDKIAVYSQQKNVFNFRNSVNIKNWSELKKVKYLLIDTNEITSNVTKAFDWIDRLEQKLPAKTIVVFTNNTINNTPLGFKFLMALNNIELLIPSHSHLIDDFSFWIKPH